MIKTYFLIVMVGGGSVVVPAPYPTEQLCKDAAEAVRSIMQSRWGYCVPHWREPDDKSYRPS